MGYYGAQVRVHAHGGAHIQQALLGPHKCVGTAPLWSANRAEQNRIGVSAKLTGGLWESSALRVDRGPTDQASLEPETMTVVTAYGLEDANGFSRDLWANAVPAEDADQGFHGRVLSKRLMASE